MNRQWLLHERPVGMIGPEHFKYVETDIPEPGEGEVLIRNLMFSFDPTQRGWTMDRESYLPPVQIGEPMRAGCVAQVVKSNHPDFSAGQMVQATNGWQDYAVVDPAHPPSSLRPMPEGAQLASPAPYKFQVDRGLASVPVIATGCTRPSKAGK